MLTGPQISLEVYQGRIGIEPYDPAQLNSNSYNLRMSDQLLVYKKQMPLHLAHELDQKRLAEFGPGILQLPKPVLEPLDMAKEEETVTLVIPPEGMNLHPGVLYLGCTVERTETPHHIPMIDGRSSTGRLGMFVHVTAGFGDQNFRGTWTLEVLTPSPLRVYPNAPVCQISYTEPVGQPKEYDGKYQHQTGPRPSGLWREFQKATEIEKK